VKNSLFRTNAAKIEALFSSKEHQPAKRTMHVNEKYSFFFLSLSFFFIFKRLIRHKSSGNANFDWSTFLSKSIFPGIGEIG
jgi:hypothetical protein